MTEKEVIEVLTNENQCLERVIKGECKIMCGECEYYVMLAKRMDSFGVAIKALEEIQQYREIGTIADVKAAMNLSQKCYEILDK